jgi:sugar phosphate isomerase/epimerase
MPLVPNFTRRDFMRVAAAGLAASTVASAKIATRIHGVYVGMQTFTLRGLSLDQVIAAMKQIGIGECELWSSHVEPKATEVPDVAKWRATVSLDYFAGVKKKFGDAGIEIYSYNPRFGGPGGRGARGAAAAPNAGTSTATPPAAPAAGDAPRPVTMTDEEIERLFLVAKALGATTINSRIPADLASRVAQAAERHRMIVGITTDDPDILAASPFYRYDVDTASYLRMGHDPLQFLQDNHDKITDVHLNDTKATGPSVALGEGDAKIKEILLFLKQKKSPIRALIDSNYPGSETSVEELRKCFDYVNRVLT